MNPSWDVEKTDTKSAERTAKGWALGAGRLEIETPQTPQNEKMQHHWLRH